MSPRCTDTGVSPGIHFIGGNAITKNEGETGPNKSKSCPENLNIRIAVIIKEKRLYLRKHYYFEQAKIKQQ